MLTLFLDFASHEKSAALATEETVVRWQPIGDHTDEPALVAAIIAMFEKTATQKDAISRIATVTGPGGFMSLRVGLSIANTLSWSRALPIVGIHLADLWAARIRNSSDAKNFLWLHSTKKDFLFIRGFGTAEKKWPKPVLASLTTLQEYLKRETTPLTYVGELIEHQASLLPMLRMGQSLPMERVLPQLCDNLVYARTPLSPWYGRGA